MPKRKKAHDLFSLLSSQQKVSVSKIMLKMVVFTSGTCTFCNKLRMKSQTCNDDNFATPIANQWRRMELAKEPNQNPRLDLIGSLRHFRCDWFCDMLYYNSSWSLELTFAVPSLYHIFAWCFSWHVRNAEQSLPCEKRFEKLPGYVTNEVEWSSLVPGGGDWNFKKKIWLKSLIV